MKQLISNNRLLTFTGSGGCGKTRLALVVALDVVEDFKDGTWWVPLAALSEPNLLPQRVAAALGVREAPGRSSSEALGEHLETKNLLLVLDNCEHLIDACAAFTDTLLHSCPDLHILATSREALGIAGERTRLVPSLSVPDPERLCPVEELGRYEAVRLFVERGVAVTSTFELTEQNAPTVARVCRQLDGIPLAIELAAAIVRVLSVQQIATRLDDSSRLLTTENRTADPRHRTLRATIDWSHGLLSEQERILFRRLSAFAGGWTIEAAEEICTGEWIEKDEVLDLLTHLVDKSLVRVAEGGGEEARYRLLETVRHYASEKLRESGEEPEIRRRHAVFFAVLGVHAEPALFGAEEGTWRGRLAADHDNIRTALAWGAEHDAELMLRLAGALWRFWWAHLSEGRTWLERALVAGGEAPAPLRVEALGSASIVASMQGEEKFAAAWVAGGELPLYRAAAEAQSVTIEASRPTHADPDPGPSGAIGELSRRELEVLGLVAERLFLSPRTVNAHLITLSTTSWGSARVLPRRASPSSITSSDLLLFYLGTPCRKIGTPIR